MNSSSNQSATIAAPSRLRPYLLPSLADVLFIAIFVALCYGNPRLRLLSDAGIGWHIRTGQWILQHHSVPHTDLFSNVPTRAWFAWEWLFDVVVAVIHGWSGLNGVLAFSAFLMALCFALLLRWTVQSGAPLLAALAFVALAVLSSTVHALARPHLVTWLFTLVCWYLLEQKRNTGWLWLLPALVLIWVNVHGGFLVAFALMGLCLVGEVLPMLLRTAESTAGSPRRNILRLAVVLLASFFASLLNPYGFHLYQHIYEYLGDPFIRQHNLEMQSPDFHSVGARCFALLLLLAGVVAVTRFRRLRMDQALVLIFFAASALFSVRNVPLAAIVMTLTVAPLLSGRAADTDRTSSRNGLGLAIRRFSRRMAALEGHARGTFWALLCVLLTIGACTNGGRILGRQILQAGFNPERFPIRAVDFLSQHPVQGPMFTVDAWGGYVIYREWPALQVVVDDRHDMYGSDYMRGYLSIIHGEKDWQERLLGTGARIVLIAKNGALANAMRGEPAWRLAYEDDQAVVFEKR